VVSDKFLGDNSFIERMRGGRRTGVAFALAVVVHALVLWGLASSFLFRFPEEPRMEPRIVALAPRIVPPPPNVSKLGPTDIVMALPRFRPRALAVVPQRRYGDPALAIWTYLCNRDFSLSIATQRACPEDRFGNVTLGVLDPLNRNGDIGALMGPDTATMSLDEAAVARGWIKVPPPKGQQGLAGKTDKSHADPTERFGPLPWDEGASKGTSYSWSKDRIEGVPDLQ
jgi:hypothetical protein